MADRRVGVVRRVWRAYYFQIEAQIAFGNLVLPREGMDRPARPARPARRVLREERESLLREAPGGSGGSGVCGPLLAATESSRCAPSPCRPADVVGCAAALRRRRRPSSLPPRAFRTPLATRQRARLASQLSVRPARRFRRTNPSSVRAARRSRKTS